MVWESPKTNWKATDRPGIDDYNRMEKNLFHLKGVEASIQADIADAISAMGQPAAAGSYQTLANKIKNISKDATATPEDVLKGTAFYADGKKQLGIWPGPMYGTGELGHFSSSSSITIQNNTGDLVVLDYKSFKLNHSHTLTVQNPVRALVIRSWGDVSISGLIDLDKKGGYGNRYITIGGVQYDLLGGLGGDGGAGGLANNGGKADSGQRAAGGLRGGGGGGGLFAGVPGTGGAKNSKSDQAGARGLGGFVDTNEQSGTPSDGGDGTYGAGGGGTAHKFGGPGTSTAGHGGAVIPGAGAAGGGGAIGTKYLGEYDHPAAQNGGAGIIGEIGGGALVIVSAAGAAIFGAITACGGKGANGGAAYRGGLSQHSVGGGGGGGGSGGGRVIIIAAFPSVPGAINLSGGPGGAGGAGYDEDNPSGPGFVGQNGSPGQNGSIQLVSTTIIA